MRYDIEQIKVLVLHNSARRVFAGKDTSATKTSVNWPHCRSWKSKGASYRDLVFPCRYQYNPIGKYLPQKLCVF